MRKTLFVAGVLSALTILATVSLASDYDGDGRDDVAVFRPSNGQWTIRGFTRIYFGTSADTPFAGDFNGDGIADPAYHRESNGFWKAKDVTQFYFGNASLGDEMVSGGSSGQRTYDYIVRPGDANDLVAALESDSYESVFIPGGWYNVNTDIHVSGVELITGEGPKATRITLETSCAIYLETDFGVTLEKVEIINGGDLAQVIIEPSADFTRIIDVEAYNSDSSGFMGNSGANYVSLINCIARVAEDNGFLNFAEDCSLTNCLALAGRGVGFHNCDNISGCLATGELTTNGFYSCAQLSSCHAWDCARGFNNCNRLSSCAASSNSIYGFFNCNYVSACSALSNGTNWSGCNYTAACNDGS